MWVIVCIVTYKYKWKKFLLIRRWKCCKLASGNKSTKKRSLINLEVSFLAFFQFKYNNLLHSIRGCICCAKLLRLLHIFRRHGSKNVGKFFCNCILKTLKFLDEIYIELSNITMEGIGYPSVGASNIIIVLS